MRHLCPDGSGSLEDLERPFPGAAKLVPARESEQGRAILGVALEPRMGLCQLKLQAAEGPRAVEVPPLNFTACVGADGNILVRGKSNPTDSPVLLHQKGMQFPAGGQFPQAQAAA